MKPKISDGVYYLILASLMILLAILMMTGCLRSPQREESDPPPCYEYRMCLYYLQKAPDKSMCKDALNECIKYYRMDKCFDIKSKYPNDREITYTSCWDKLE